MADEFEEDGVEATAAKGSSAHEGAHNAGYEDSFEADGGEVTPAPSPTAAKASAPAAEAAPAPAAEAATPAAAPPAVEPSAQATATAAAAEETPVAAEATMFHGKATPAVAEAQASHQEDAHDEHLRLMTANLLLDSADSGALAAALAQGSPASAPAATSRAVDGDLEDHMHGHGRKETVGEGWPLRRLAPSQVETGHDEWEEAFDSKDSFRGSRFKSMSSSLPNLGDYNDIKKKTEFAGVTVDGVVKGPTFMTHISGFKTGPKWTLGTKLGCSFIKSSSTPAPGTYTVPAEDRSAKYKAPPKFSFGGCSRFALGESPMKKAPGPGAYNPRDPNDSSIKVGFGGISKGGRGPPVPEANPGPGAYEARTTMGQGKMFTATGRHPAYSGKSSGLPGPGAYNPSTSTVFQSPPKCGFGTSTRADIAGGLKSWAMPGPGTYDMQNMLSVGSSGPKYSATSRRRMHDLNSYITPGPGSYNSHVTMFGR